MSLSDLPLLENSVVVFDLDDTLYFEREFVLSGFRAAADIVARESNMAVFERLCELLASRHEDPFGRMIAEYGLPIEWKSVLIDAYRNHAPTLSLAPEVAALLASLRRGRRQLGIITDGRSVTQRNKIRALGLGKWVDTIVISDEFGSEKPDERNYRFFERRFVGRSFVYVGNNVAKDFIAPNRLGWMTVGVMHDKRHVHPPPAADTPAHALPQHWIERLA